MEGNIKERKEEVKMNNERLYFTLAVVFISIGLGFVLSYLVLAFGV